MWVASTRLQLAIDLCALRTAIMPSRHTTLFSTNTRSLLPSFSRQSILHVLLRCSSSQGMSCLHFWPTSHLPPSTGAWPRCVDVYACMTVFYTNGKIFNCGSLWGWVGKDITWWGWRINMLFTCLRDIYCFFLSGILFILLNVDGGCLSSWMIWLFVLWMLFMCMEFVQFSWYTFHLRDYFLLWPSVDHGFALLILMSIALVMTLSLRLCNSLWLPIGSTGMIAVPRCYLAWFSPGRCRITLGRAGIHGIPHKNSNTQRREKELSHLVVERCWGPGTLVQRLKCGTKPSPTPNHPTFHTQKKNPSAW